MVCVPAVSSSFRPVAVRTEAAGLGSSFPGALMEAISLGPIPMSAREARVHQHTPSSRWRVWRVAPAIRGNIAGWSSQVAR